MIAAWRYIGTGSRAAAGIPWHAPETMIGQPVPTLFPTSELVMIGMFLTAVAALAIARLRRP